MDLVDIVTGAEAAPYTRALATRLSELVDCVLIPSKAYASSTRGIAYRLLHHPRAVRSARRRGAILHVDSQLLAYVLSRGHVAPAVVTCHDVVPFLPEFDDPSYMTAGRSILRRFRRRLAEGLRRADRIIAVSESTKRDLVKMGYPSRTIDVVPQGVDRAVFRPRGLDECLPALRRHGIPVDRNLILFVGTEHPRKNVPALLRAFARLPPAANAFLVKVGRPRHPQRQELLDLVQSLSIQSRVAFVDVVADEDLPLLYAAARVLVLPSLHEGFGLPPLEAMACGTPAAVSRVTSLPEVAADAAAYFDPQSTEEIATTIAEVLLNPSLREELCARGLSRAALFPWERTVEGVLQVYRRVRTTA